ncbi:MAG: Hsp70 family protein [Oscillospiraceae bacterium]
MNKILGIDLGTTYSCTAYIDENEKPVVIKNSDGELTTPSVVLFETATNVVVGSVAKESVMLYPEQVVSFVKRKIGKEGMFDYILGNKLTPEEVSAYILRKIVNDAVDVLRSENRLAQDETITDVVITCPAYFGTAERDATKKAGEIAGLTVIEILNEPTAAAICYGLTDLENEKNVLVYDLGGGTFDVTMIAIHKEEIKVICTGGDHMLGGKDWDDAIIGYLISQFCNVTGTSEDVYNDLEFIQNLMLSAEIAKKSLTQKEKHPILINYNGEKARVELTRVKFQEISENLLESTISLTKDMLSEAEKKGYPLSSLNEIILVGGATRMPMIKKRVEEAFGVQVNQYDPDEAVAKGAAIYANRIQFLGNILEKQSKKTGKSQKQIKEDIASGTTSLQEVAKGLNIQDNAALEMTNLNIINVNSRSFGTIAVVNGEHKIVNIIFKNSSLPAHHSQFFGTTVENQKNVNIEIMETLTSDEITDAQLGVKVGEAVLELPENLPKGTKISVDFYLNESGLLEVHAQESAQFRTVSATFEVASSMSSEEMQLASNRTQMAIIN